MAVMSGEVPTNSFFHRKLGCHPCPSSFSSERVGKREEEKDTKHEVEYYAPLLLGINFSNSLSGGGERILYQSEAILGGKELHSITTLSASGKVLLPILGLFSKKACCQGDGCTSVAKPRDSCSLGGPRALSLPTVYTRHTIRV